MGICLVRGIEVVIIGFILILFRVVVKLDKF